MESRTNEISGESVAALSANMERMEARLEAAATLVERIAALVEERDGEVRRLVAAVDTAQPAAREAELEQKLQAAQQQIAELRAQIESRAETRSDAQTTPSARKTVPAATAQFLAKQGVALESVEAGALDAALSGLSLEQRIAVKAQLLRAGVVA